VHPTSDGCDGNRDDFVIGGELVFRCGFTVAGFVTIVKMMIQFGDAIPATIFSLFF